MKRPLPCAIEKILERAGPVRPIKKISDKKLASLGGKIPFSTISKRSESPRKSKDKATDKGWTEKGQQQEPRTRIRPTNPARKAREFKRAYHSKERVRFVKSLPCCYCASLLGGFVDGGKSHNAHTEGGGMRRKGPYTSIIPLCFTHHKRYDERLYPFDAANQSLRDAMKNLAPIVEARWSEQGNG